ncbi:hypothetical protein MBLNU457_7737t1 [Dothideomycetes sp. NU457]
MPLNTNQDQKRLRTTKFPPEFDQKVDSTKVNFNVMKLWINEQLHEHMGIDDDIVKDLIVELIETVKYPDIKSLQIQLVGFLDDKAAPFCKELWNLLLDAQASEQGVPQKLIAAKKDEMQRQRAEKERARAAVSRRQQDDFEARGREADEARAREDKERYYRRQQMRGGKPPNRPDRDFPRHRRDNRHLVKSTATFLLQMDQTKDVGQDLQGQTEFATDHLAAQDLPNLVVADMSPLLVVGTTLLLVDAARHHRHRDVVVVGTIADLLRAHQEGEDRIGMIGPAPRL